MFTKNDMVLFIAKTIIYVLLGILAVGVLALGIWLAIEYDLLYLAITFGGWILCGILWVFASLFFSFLIDVKLIRNKLYGEKNDFLGFRSNQQKAANEYDAPQQRETPRDYDWYSKQ